MTATMEDPETKVVPIRPQPSTPPLDPRLEELRQILRDSDIIAADDELSDEAVVNDKSKFRRRFGRGFDWERPHREALIKLKREWDLTDREIRLFWETRNLRKTRRGVELTASPWAAVSGSLQLLYVVPLCMIAVLAGWQNLLFAPSRYLSAWLMLFGIAVYAVVLYWSQIKPWLVQRQLHRRLVSDERP